MLTTTTLRRIRDWSFWLFWSYLILIATAEILTVTGSPEAGLILHILLLIGLMLHSALGRGAEQRKLALSLTLAPLIRLLSLSLPLSKFPQIVQYPVVSVPLLIATWIIIHQLGVPRQTLGLRPRSLVLQMMLMGGGMGLGAVEYVILQPTSLTTTFSWSALWLPVLILVLFTGFNEELIFRGLLQSVATPVLSRWSLIYIALLFAVLHIGYRSPVEIVFVFAVGLLFGQIVRWTGSIIGVSLMHGMVNVTLFLTMPYLVEHPSTIIFALAPWLIGGGSVIAGIALRILVLYNNAAQEPVQAGAVPAMSLRLLRRERGLTYTELAQRSGMPARLLAEFEHGLRPAEPAQVLQIAQALGVAPNLLTSTT